jgi:hypothetical protein
MFGTSRGIRLLLTHTLTAFGLTSAIVQVLAIIFPGLGRMAVPIITATLLICAAWGVSQAYPRSHISRTFAHPKITITVLIGDLFNEEAHIVVGFSDTFDTSITNSRVISSESVQGQLVDRRYGRDDVALDRELRIALGRVTPVATESRRAKPHGKLRRYPIGTVAVIGNPKRLVFAVAYSTMGNDLIARSTMDNLWRSLNSLWDALYAHAERESVAMPLVGSGLSRIDVLDRGNLVRIIVLSFLARSRQVVVCRELRIVIWPRDVEELDLLEIAAFLRTL